MPTRTAAASPRKSQATSYSASLRLCYIRSFVILTPFFPPHPTPRRSFGPILPRRRVTSPRSLSPPSERIEPSTPRATTLPTLGGLECDEPVQGHLHIVPNSLTFNFHDPSAYSSQTPHTLVPSFLVHRLGDYDRSTDINLHLVLLLHSWRSDKFRIKITNVPTAGHVNNDFRLRPIRRLIPFDQDSLLASKPTQHHSLNQPP